MKISLICIGKTNDKHISQCIEKYTARIPHYIPFEMVVLSDVKSGKNTTETLQKELEGRAFMSQIQPGDKVVLLDERGKEYTSRDFSKFIENEMVGITRRLVFVIGGPYGFSAEMYNRANAKLSLSQMTFSHEMVRLFFVEQLYRAMTILKGEPYHHD